VKLFWKVYLAVFTSFVAVVAAISYGTSARQIAEAESRIVKEHKMVGSLLTGDIERRRAESSWPFENLMCLSQGKDFLFWWVVESDGTIHLANQASFIGSSAYRCFPEAAEPAPAAGRVILNRRKNCGLFLASFGLGNPKWSFWLGFSTEEISQAARRIVLSATLFSVLGLAALAVVLFPAMKCFTSPIQALAQGAAILGDGNLSYRVPVKSDDELGWLAHAFNQMAEHLETTTTSIDKLNREIAERQRIEDELRWSEERFKTLFEYAPDAYYLHDLQGRVIDVNKAAEQLTGYCRDEFIDHVLFDLDIFPSSEKPEILSLVTQSIAGFTTGPDELTVTRKDGSQVVVEATTLSLRIKGEPVVLGVARDITERKKAEEELRESRAKYRDLFENARDGIFTMDLTGRFTSCNRAVAALHGYSQDEFTRLTMKELLTPESYARAVQLLQKALAQKAELNEPEPWEFHLVKKDGTIFDGEVRTRLLWSQGQIVGVHGITRDVTERRKAEAELRRSEERFRQVAESAGEFIWEVDAEGLYTYANPIVEGILGYQPQDVVGKKHFYDFFLPEEREGLETAALEAFARRESFHGFINSNVHRDGHVVILETNGMPVVDDQGNLTGYRGVDTDITERKEAEQRQAQLVRQLQEHNQELKEFAYVISHDLKSPLRAIGVIVDWLSTDYLDQFDEQGKEYLTLLVNRVSRMSNLIDGVLQYSRVGRTEQGTGPVDLAQLVPEIIENLGVPAHISIQIAPDLPTVAADVTRITQVFQNLLSNAIKYMDKPQGNIAVGCVEEEGFWKFSVCDNGPGIEQRHFERIFKLFQTLAPRDTQESTGVGLTIAKKIVEMYGGRIWVESEVGKGSTFFFTFPQKKEAEVRACVAAGAPCGAAEVSPRE